MFTCVFTVEDLEGFFELFHGLFVVLFGLGAFRVFNAFPQFTHHFSLVWVMI